MQELNHNRRVQVAIDYVRCRSSVSYFAQTLRGSVSRNVSDATRIRSRMLA